MGTQNGSGLLLSPQPLYAIANSEKKLTNILKILFFVCIEHVKFQEASFNSN